MKQVTGALLAFFWKSGGLGLLLLGILDSSFLFAPLGNDILLVALAAREDSAFRVLYYALMATLGSVLGCLLVDLVSRRAGEAGLEKRVPKRRLEYVRGKVAKSAGWALAVASIAPPPFPFSPFIMAASALQYPRKRMVAIVGAMRMIRFTSLGILGLLTGRRILRWAENDVVQGILVGFVILCLVGSVLSVYGWVRRSRTKERGALMEEPAGDAS